MPNIANTLPNIAEHCRNITITLPAAGIGGGINSYGKGKGGTVHISGGTVITKGGNLHWSGDGIGAGGDSSPSTFGTLTVEDGLTVYGDSSDPPTTSRTDYDTTRYRFMTVK